MKFSGIKTLLLTLGFLAATAAGSLAQNQWIDSILPPDHLLENLPWMGEDGKIESKGLFDFEDIRGIGQKDLILIYRQSVPVNELDKPHNQTLIVCFYDSKLQKYVKNFEDEGGTIQWVKFIQGPDKKSLHLILQRDDLKGSQVLKGFAILNGSMKQVLEAAAPQIFSTFSGSQILCSSKESPKDTGGAEHVFSWDELKSRYSEGKSSGPAGWSGSSIAVPVAAAAPKPIVTPPPSALVAPSSPASAVNAKHKAKNGWWDEPLDAQASLQKLKTEIVPQLVKDKQIPVMGQKAKAFFEAVADSGVKGKELASMRATYYAAVASATLDEGDAKGAAYYLKTVFQLQPDNPDGLAVKAKLKP